MDNLTRLVRISRLILSHPDYGFGRVEIDSDWLRQHLEYFGCRIGNYDMSSLMRILVAEGDLTLTDRANRARRPAARGRALRVYLVTHQM